MFYRKYDCTLCLCMGTRAGGCTCARAQVQVHGHTCRWVHLWMGTRCQALLIQSGFSLNLKLPCRQQSPGPLQSLSPPVLWCGCRWEDGQAQLFQALEIQTQVFLFAKQSLLHWAILTSPSKFQHVPSLAITEWRIWEMNRWQIDFTLDSWSSGLCLLMKHINRPWTEMLPVVKWFSEFYPLPDSKPSTFLNIRFIIKNLWLWLYGN